MSSLKNLIVPSVLPADFAKLGEECADLQEAGADRIQFDVMDGNFVPNLTFGPDVIASVRAHTSIGFEAHLMIEHPEDFYEKFIDAGCELIIIHAETTRHTHRLLTQIKDAGARTGLAFNPSTPISEAENLLDLLDMILVMTVNPGFGGQAYIPAMGSKIEAARSLADSASHKIEVEVDGGINEKTITHAAARGADVFISGSSLYNHPGGLTAGVKTLREAADSVTAQ